MTVTTVPFFTLTMRALLSVKTNVSFEPFAAAFETAFSIDFI
jgi:hypothetical protein